MTLINIVLLLTLILFSGCSIKYDKSGEWRTKKPNIYNNNPDTFHIEIGEIWYPYLSQTEMNTVIPEILNFAKATFIFVPIDGKDPSTRHFSGIDFSLFRPGGGGLGGTSQGPTFHINTDVIKKEFTFPLKLQEKNTTTILSCDFPKVKDPRYILDEIIVRFEVENPQFKDATSNITMNLSDNNDINNFFIIGSKLDWPIESIRAYSKRPIISLKAYALQQDNQVIAHSPTNLDTPNKKIPIEYKRLPEVINEVVAQRIGFRMPEGKNSLYHTGNNMDLLRRNVGSTAQITLTDYKNTNRNCNGVTPVISETWILQEKTLRSYRGEITYYDSYSTKNTPTSYAWQIDYNQGVRVMRYLNGATYDENMSLNTENTLHECTKKDIKDIVTRLRENDTNLTSEGLYYQELLNRTYLEKQNN